MHILLDGSDLEVADSITVDAVLRTSEAAEVLGRLSIPLSSVLLVLNGTVLPHGRLKKQKLAEGDCLDLVLPTFGG